MFLLVFKVIGVDIVIGRCFVTLHSYWAMVLLPFKVIGQISLVTLYSYWSVFCYPLKLLVGVFVTFGVINILVDVFVTV